MRRVSTWLGNAIARYLQVPSRDYVPFNITSVGLLHAELRPGDVLLVEGNQRISAAIKYLTHSTWSHAAFCAGGPAGQELIEADLTEGVHRVGLSDYGHLNTRICRPVRLRPGDLEQVVAYMEASLGRSYDLKNVIDLARYLFPLPPVPARYRRRMLALGSGDPTRAICSTLIAEAFQSVRYPILPEKHYINDGAAERELLHIRHHSLFTPRDFDLSPYFEVIKPTLDQGFDYRAVEWDGDPPSTASPESVHPAI